MRIVLLLAVVIFLLWRGWRGWRAFAVRKALTASPHTPTAMLACRYCGVHLPENEAIRSTEGTFCCQQHRLNMHRE